MSLRSCKSAALGLCLMIAGCTSVDDERWQQYNQIGVQTFAKGDYRNALECFDLALTHHPQDPVLIFNCAQCYDRLGDTKRAEQYYAYAIQLDPKNGDARLALFALYYRTSRAADANQKIQEWFTQDPKSPDPYVADAWRLRQERAYPSAQSRLQQALSIDPHSRRALTELAVLYEIEGLPELALIP